MSMAKARIAVIGAGLMGHGIAQVFAVAGHDVTITDSVAASLDTAKSRIAAGLTDLGDDPRAVERVTPHGDLAAAVRDADYVVEAVSENLPLKQKLFAEIEKHVRPDTILASNTSVIPITDIMGDLKQREPRARDPLVESADAGAAGRGHRHAMDLAAGDRFHDEAARRRRQEAGACEEGCARLHRQPARSMRLWREAVSLVERGICDAETVDTVIKAAFGRRLAVLGPLENADLVGTDLTLAIHQTVLPDIEHRPGPSPYLEKLVADGKLGFKSGEGFRKWTARAAGCAAGQGRAAPEESACGRCLK